MTPQIAVSSELIKSPGAAGPFHLALQSKARRDDAPVRGPQSSGAQPRLLAPKQDFRKVATGFRTKILLR
jgi:hypothetical protein